ncbi:DUF2306 domain-containing protein [Runella sp. SP2]|nr:DUF2306 domain-containing protein [Runella sp. SP2]
MWEVVIFVTSFLTTITMKKIAWILVVVLAFLVGMIPISYLTDVKQGYLELKSPETLRNTFWQIGFVTHIAFGSVAITIGWLQFSHKLLTNFPKWHRLIGKIYVITGLLCSGAGIFIGFYAHGGPIAMAGFVCGGCVYFYTTLQGYVLIRAKNVVKHQAMMTYSYAACLGAVSLRILIPLSVLLPYEYTSVYNVVAWLSWLFNLGIAFWVNKKRDSPYKQGRTAAI